MNSAQQSIKFEGKIQWRFIASLIFYLAIILLIPWIVPSDAGLFFAPASSIAATVVILLSLVLLRYRGTSWWITEPKFWALSLALYTLLTNLWAASSRESLQVTIVQISTLLLFILLQYQSKLVGQLLVLAMSISGIALYVYGMGAGVHWWPAVDAVYGANQLASIFQYHNTFGSFELAVGIAGLLAGMQWRQWWINAVGMLAFIISIDSVVGSYSRTVWVIAAVTIVITFIVRGIVERSLWSLLLTALGLITGGLTALLTLRALDQAHGTSLILSLAIGVAMAVLLVYADRWLSQHIISAKMPLAILGVLFVLGAAVVYKYRTHLFHGTTSITSRLHTITFHSISLQERFYYYQNALHMWLSSPVFGSGGGTWATKFQAFQTLPYWSEQVHSSIFDILLNGGIFGLTLTVILVIFVVRAFVSHYRRTATQMQRLFVAGTALAATVLFVHSIVDFDFAFGYYQYIFAILLALAVGPSPISMPEPQAAKRKQRGAAHQKGAFSPRTQLGFTITFAIIGGIALLGGLSLSVSQILVNMASSPTVSPNSKLALTQTAASWAPYDGQLQLALANYYLQTGQSSQDTGLFAQAWSAAQAAQQMSPWDPTVQTQTAIIAYQLRQTPKAIAWANLALHDAPFNETVYRNPMGLTLWTSAQQLKADPTQGRSGLQNVLSLYADYQRKSKVINTTLFPDSVPMQLDASMQVYVATADTLLGHPRASLQVMNPLLTANRDQAAVNLYEIDSILDDRQLKKSSALDAYMIKQINATPSALQEYNFLRTLV